MSNLESIISSFHIQENLNPKIWELPKEKFMGDPEGQHYTMRPKVRERLLEIAYEFIEFVKNLLLNFDRNVKNHLLVFYCLDEKLYEYIMNLNKENNVCSQF
jgi:hypothetical protein